MKQRIAEIVVLLVICAVAAVWLRGGQGHSLSGTWKVDIEKQMAQPLLSKMPEEQKMKAREMLGKGTFTLTDKTVTMKAGDHSEEADLSVSTQEGDTWVIETRDNKGKVETSTVTWTDNDHFVMAPAGSPMKFYLERQP